MIIIKIDLKSFLKKPKPLQKKKKNLEINLKKFESEDEI